MVIDTSALLAILLGEEEAPRLVEAIARAELRLVGVPTLVEASAVMLGRKGPAGELALDALLARLDISTVALSVEAGQNARRGYSRFGKGVGSPGVLNFGDCLSYGLAVALDEPLLFKGGDFAQTDVTAVEY